jgi:REP element-mobilizing transposase RayT
VIQESSALTSKGSDTPTPYPSRMWPRLARVVIPELPYHVTRRGNGGQRVFFSDEDYAACRDLLATATREARVGVRAGRLMPDS